MLDLLIECMLYIVVCFIVLCIWQMWRMCFDLSVCIQWLYIQCIIDIYSYASIVYVNMYIYVWNVSLVCWRRCYVLQSVGCCGVIVGNIVCVAYCCCVCIVSVVIIWFVVLCVFVWRNYWIHMCVVMCWCFVNVFIHM